MQEVRRYSKIANELQQRPTCAQISSPYGLRQRAKHTKKQAFKCPAMKYVKHFTRVN